MRVVNAAIFVAAAAGVIAAIGVFASAASAASVYTPASSVRMCNQLPAVFVDPTLAGNPSCTESLGAGAHPNMGLTLNSPAPNLKTQADVVFVPASFTTAAGGTIPAGTKIGGVTEDVTYGLNNGPCNNTISYATVLYTVALPNNVGNPPASTNLAYPLPAGTADRFSKWKVGSAPGGGDPSGIDPGTDIAHAAGSSIPFQNYPKYLLDMFGNVVPRAAYGGLTLSQGYWQVVYYLQFDPGQLAALPGAYALMNSNMGAPLAIVPGDPTVNTFAPSSITDVCTPRIVNTMLLGVDESATYNRLTSPVAGTYFFLEYLASGRDTDQDGFENDLDTCPLAPNVGDIRVGGPTGDADTDGIDDACDLDYTPFPPDSDHDSYDNREDNCPLIANMAQTESESGTAADRGPKWDAMGDDCDTGTISITQNGHSLSLTVSPTVSNGRYLTITNVMPKCIGGTDADGDGYCTTADSQDSGGCTSTVPPSCTVRHNLWSGATHPGMQMDTDGDGWSDVMETYLGTDPGKACAQDAPANNESPMDNWPYDLDDNSVAGLSDITKFGPPFNLNVNQGPFNGVPGVRFDLNNDGVITLADITKFSAVFNKKCGTAGTLGIPDWSQQ